LLIPLSWMNMFTSALFSQTPSICALAKSRRHGWILCGEITFLKKTSSYTVREFHTF
jgi:hypothetical protein